MKWCQENAGRVLSFFKRMLLGLGLGLDRPQPRSRPRTRPRVLLTPLIKRPFGNNPVSVQASTLQSKTMEAWTETSEKRISGKGECSANVSPQNIMAANYSLYEEREIEPWKEAFLLYDKMLNLKAEKEKKEKAGKLLELDYW